MRIIPTERSIREFFRNHSYVRNTVYASSIAAISAAAFRYGPWKVGLPLAALSLLMKGEDCVRRAKIVMYTPNNKIEHHIGKIARRIMTLSLMEGIILAGVSFAWGLQQERLFLHAVDLADARQILHHLWSLAGLGGILMPLAFKLIHYNDMYFYPSYGGQKNPYLKDFKSNFHNYIQNPSSFIYNQFGPLLKIVAEIGRTNSFLGSMLFFRIDMLKLCINLGVENPLQRTLSSGKIKRVVNAALFYSMTLALMAARLYYHPVSTGIFFALGMVVFPTLQSEATLKKTWGTVPDFLGMSSDQNCYDIWRRLSVTLCAIHPWNIPMACFNGLFLAEAVRYYVLQKIPPAQKPPKPGDADLEPSR